MLPPVKFLRTHRKQADALLAPGLRSYLDERILPGSWYPEADLTAMLPVVVEILPPGEVERWELIGEHAADAHIAGPYESIVHRGPRGLLQSFNPIWRLQHDTGQWEISIADDDAATARLADFGAGMPSYGRLMIGYLRRLIMLSGVRTATVELLECDDDSGTWEVSWQV